MLYPLRSQPEAEKQERFSEAFYAKFDKSVSVKPRSTSRSDPERHSARRTADARPSNYMSGQQYRTSHSTHKSVTSASTRDVQTRAELRCYECERRGRFARECPTRLKGARTRNSPGKGNPSGRSTRPRSSGDESPPHEPGRQTGNQEPGKRLRGEGEGSSLHLDTHGNAVERPTVSVLLEHGSPTVSLEIEGEPKRLIVDTGSNVSILQPGVSQ